MMSDQDEYPPDGDVPEPRAKEIKARALANRPKPKRKHPSLKPGGTRMIAQEKRRKALELRKGGASYQSIADAVGYKDASGARKAVIKAFGAIIQEPALELRTMQVERLNHMLLTLWPKVQQGDERAIQTSLAVMDKLDRLVGTEAAQHVDINVTQKAAVLVIDGDRDDYIRAAKRMIGIASDGTNIPAPVLNTPPTGTGSFDPVDNPVDNDVIEGEIVESVTGSDQTAPEDPFSPEEVTHSDQNRRTFKFGVDPLSP